MRYDILWHIHSSFVFCSLLSVYVPIVWSEILFAEMNDGVEGILLGERQWRSLLIARRNSEFFQA
jgi:hypothetical protein